MYKSPFRVLKMYVEQKRLLNVEMEGKFQFNGRI